MVRTLSRCTGIALTAAALTAFGAAAQAHTSSDSALDPVTKTGVLRACTPGGPQRGSRQVNQRNRPSNTLRLNAMCMWAVPGT